MSTLQVDFLIIGQGLAGSILAFELIERGQTVMVIDNAHHASSSIVAAGIINPITGHRFNLSNGFVEYSEVARKFYDKAQSRFAKRFVSELKQYRLIKNPGQASYYQKRCDDETYDEFIGPEAESTVFLDAKNGVAEIKQTSIVDTKALLHAIRDWLIANNAYRQQRLDYTQIVTAEESPKEAARNSIKYDDIEASKLIFCEGYQAINNPWLKNLPFKLAKGEVLTVTCDTQNNADRTMLSWGSWLVPFKGLGYKLGSNYEWQSTDLSLSNDVKDKLLNGLKLYTDIDAEPTKHEAGIRPTTIDRHAFVGELSQLSNVYCFNGFGSKGCLTIPKHADLLCRHMLNQEPLPEELRKWL